MTTKISQNGFTLIEVLVVVAILGILMAITVPRFGRMMENAQEQKCRNNLRQLHTAVMSHVNDRGGNLPYAMSFEVFDVVSQTYHERRGWVSWQPPQGRLNDRWPNDVTRENGMKQDGGMGENARFGVENGTLFPYMNRSLEHYVCPIVRRAKTQQTAKIYRTYAMNRFFFSPRNPRWYARRMTAIGSAESFETYIPEAAKLMVFVEVEPTEQTHTHANADPATRSGNDKNATDSIVGDCTIGPVNKTDTKDIIYATHNSPVRDSEGKMIPTALAVFLDGHIEKVYVRNQKGENAAWYYARGRDPEEDS